MDFLGIAQKRISIRSFSDKKVEDEKLLKVLEAARLAPSACNIQPLHLIVLREAENRKKLEPVYNRQWFLNAPVIIAACCDRSVSWHRSDGKDYGDVDIAIALDHITLAAADLDLGTCWIGAFNPALAKSVLCLPDNIDPVAFTPLGYASTKTEPRPRKKLEDIVHWESFGSKEMINY